MVVMTSLLHAQENTDTTTIKRVDKLEKILAKLPKISGFIDVRYQYGKDISSFDIRRARLDVKGDINKMFDYRLQLEFAPSPKILDAYTRIKIKPYFNIQLGSFKVPFTLENPYSPTGLELMDNAMAITKLCGYTDLSGINANGRDVGLMFYGGGLGKKGFNIIEYALGIFNGAGINIKDNNKSKDIVGRLNINPIKSLTLSASAYIGEMVLMVNGKAVDLYERRDRYAFGVKYDDKKFVFRSEYIAGLTSHTRSAGGYALFGYTFIEKLTPAIRFDIFQDDIHKINTRQINYTGGISYWINKHFRCQIDYTHQTFWDKKKNGGLLVAMITAMF